MNTRTDELKGKRGLNLTNEKWDWAMKERGRSKRSISFWEMEIRRWREENSSRVNGEVNAKVKRRRDC